MSFVWNYANDLGFKHLHRTGNFFSAYDIAKYTASASKAGLNLHSKAIQAVTEELVTRRKQFKKAKLKWRVSNNKSARRSLGWIAFKKSAIKCQNGQVKYGNHWFSLWDSCGLSKYNVKTGAFVENSRGHRYICLVVDIPELTQASGDEMSIGIDLGLKDFATLSNGEKIVAQRTYRLYEKKLAEAQRANKKHRVKAIHVKIKNIRNDFQHQPSRRLVNSHAAIFVGMRSTAS